MLRKLLLCLFIGSALLVSESVVHPAQPAAQASPNAQALAISTNRVAKDTYTVWYRAPGRRYTGISGLSYYDACRIRDDYLQRGWDAYIKIN